MSLAPKIKHVERATTLFLLFVEQEECAKNLLESVVVAAAVAVTIDK